MTREEFVTAWRIYAAAALQGLATNPKAHAPNATCPIFAAKRRSLLT